MRKALWSTAALVTLLSGAMVTWGPKAQAAGTKVAMGSSNEPLKFLPAEITVPVGGTVEWVNDTDFQHDVKTQDNSFGSKLLNKGEKYEFTFSKAGEYPYFCEPHESAGMTGIVRVGSSTPTTAATTTTTAATTATTAPGASTTTTTAKAAAGETTTTTAAGTVTTATTAPPAVTPTSAPESAGATTTTAAADHAGEAAAGEHGGEAAAKEEDDDESSPIGIAFAAVSTILLIGICAKLLGSKS